MPDQRWLVLVSLQLFSFNIIIWKKGRNTICPSKFILRLIGWFKRKVGPYGECRREYPNTRFLKVSLMRLLQWEICGGKSLNPLSLGKVCGMLRALDRLLLSIEILWVLCTGTSFIAAPNPWMRTVSIVPEHQTIIVQELFNQRQWLKPVLNLSQVTAFC